MGIRLLLVLAIYGLGTLGAFRSVVWAAAIFIWNDIFQPLSFAKSHGLLPVAHYVFAVLVFAFGFNWFRGRLRPSFGVFGGALAGFMFWILITVVASPFKEAAINEYIRYLKYLGPLFLIYSSIQTMKEAKILTAVLCGSVGIWAAQAGAHCLISGPNISIGIPGGQMTERNDLTAGAVGTIPILMYFAFSYDWKFRKAVRIGCILMAVLCVCAIFLSLSRGSSIGFFVSLLFYIFLVSKKKLRDVVLLGCFVAMAFALAPESWYERMSTIELGAEQTEGSAMQRMEAMTGAFRATLDRPIFGWGPAGWLKMAPVYTSMTANPHNIYLKLSSEVGITGLLIYLFIMGMTYVRLMRTANLAKRAGNLDVARLCIALTTCIIGLLCALSFLNAPLGEYLWSWVCIANAVPGVYQKELYRQKRQARQRVPAAAPPGGGGVKPPAGPSLGTGPGSAPGKSGHTPLGSSDGSR